MVGRTKKTPAFRYPNRGAGEKRIPRTKNLGGRGQREGELIFADAKKKLSPIGGRDTKGGAMGVNPSGVRCAAGGEFHAIFGRSEIVSVGEGDRA